jgi:hypothetical protein
VDLWAVTYPATTPCGGRDEAVKVTKPYRPHVRMTLTEPYRLQNEAIPETTCNLLNIKSNKSVVTFCRRETLKFLGNIYA